MQKKKKKNSEYLSYYYKWAEISKKNCCLDPAFEGERFHKRYPDNLHITFAKIAYAN